MGTRDKLAALAKKKRTLEEEAQPVAPEGRPRRTPVTLFCGHWDWDYDPETGVCGQCRHKRAVYPSQVASGFVAEMNHHVERLGNEVTPLVLALADSEDPEVLDALRRLRDRVEHIRASTIRATKRSGGIEVFDVYPDIGKTHDAAWNAMEERDG